MACEYLTFSSPKQHDTISFVIDVYFIASMSLSSISYTRSLEGSLEILELFLCLAIVLNRWLFDVGLYIKLFKALSH